MKSKYIVVKQGSFEYPVVFSELMTHADIARAVGGEVVGAGFCFINDDRYGVYGESVSCKVKNRGETDEKVLNKMLGVDEY